jgi:hypothetical protein
VTSWLLFALGVAVPPAITFATKPRSASVRAWLTVWLVTAAITGTITALASAWLAGGWLSAGDGYLVSGLIAAVILWWRRKRPDRALRAYGAKSLARVAALARSMPRARVPLPQGAPS